MADAANRKGFSGRLMGMKFMQRAAQKLGKRKADDTPSETPPNDAAPPPHVPPEPTAAVLQPTDQPGAQAAPDVTVLLHRGKARCRVIVQSSVHDDHAQLLAGRKSFSHVDDDAEKNPPEDGGAEAAPAAQPPVAEGPPTKKRRGLSQLLTKNRRT